MHVLKEAVVNSIQAKATKIDICFTLENSEKQEELALDNDAQYKFENITIVDNGDGFTKDNKNSFEEVGSDYKSGLGCLGRGRLTYLKVFESVKIESVSSDGYYSNQNFSVNFNKWGKRLKKENEASFTKIQFSQYKKKNKKKQVERGFDPLTVRENILTHILPLLASRKPQDEITINFALGPNVFSSISLNDVPAMKQVKFNITNEKLNDKPETEFTLDYFIEKNEGTGKDLLDGYYTADSRIVHSFTDGDEVGKDNVIHFSTISKYRILFFLSSNYLDDQKGGERLHFDIPKSNDEDNFELGWKEINIKLQEVLRGVINSHAELKFLDQEYQKACKKIKEENLHLVSYIGSSNTIGSQKADSLLGSAEKKFLEDKKAFKKDSAHMPIEQAMSKASDLAGKELIEYVQMRDHVITKLEEINDTDKRESSVHNLFMQRYSSTSEATKSNLWLLDDKFMGYSKAYSEFQLGKISEEVFGNNFVHNNDSRRADIAAFYADDKRLIIIEMKKPNSTDYDAGKGHQELAKYSRYFSDKGIDQIYLYLIATITDEVIEDFLDTYGYRKIFSNEGVALQGVVGRQKFTVTFLNPEAVISDARARNQTFIDMVKENLTTNELT